jgi:hypothetical protein
MSPLVPNRELSPLHNNNNNGGDLTHSPNKQLDNAAIHGGTCSSPTAAAAGSPMRRRSVSMLEMADLEDLKEFSNAMDQLEREHNHHHNNDHLQRGGEDVDSNINIKEMGGFLGGANNIDGGGGDNGDFLFFDDAHDEDNDGDNGDHNLVTLVAKAAFKEHDNHNPHALLKSGGGGGSSSSGSGTPP